MPTVLAVLGTLGLLIEFVYVTNIGQLVHRTPNPSWLERLGRR